MKKINYLKSLLLMLALLLPAAVVAHDFEMDGIFYNINGDEVVVTYKGSSFSEYSEYFGDVVIPASVSYNGMTYAVTAIGEYAFSCCSYLRISIPNSVTSIGAYAFLGCQFTPRIEIPNSVTTIGDAAFDQCHQLTSISIGSSVSSIGRSILSSCENLAIIEVAGDNPTYDSRDNCNAIIETASNTLIAGCANTVIPNTITAIGAGAFVSCHGLTNIEIPNSVTTIGVRSFYSCHGLTGIQIPNSVTSIGEGAFIACDGLKSIEVAGDNPVYDSRNNCNAIIMTASNTLITGCMNTVIPNTVTAIEEHAFCFCDSLTSIQIPNSVTTIGISAFACCYNLASISIGSSVTRIRDQAFFSANKINSIFCYCATPPSCVNNTFSDYSATLHVPAASLAAYFTAPCWKNFENIIGDAVEPIDITINMDSIELHFGEQLQLIATITPANASYKVVTWMSSDTSVAVVDNGSVTAVGYGECDIIASCFGMQAICHVSIFNRISLDQQEAMLLPNHMLTLIPTASTVPGSYMVSSSDPTVAAARVMNGKVQVVGIKEGTTTITVVSADGLAIPATCLVTVYTELGDVNCDGFINVSDVTSLINYILCGDDSQISTKNSNVNDDVYINVSDVTALISIILSGN